MSLTKAYAALLLPLVLASYSYAEKNLHLEPSLGLVAVENRDYDLGLVLDHALAYTASGFAVRTGILHMADINPDGASESENAEIKITGPYISAAKVIDLHVLELELGAGLLYAETEAHLMRRRVGEHRDISPMLNAKIIKNITNFFAVQADWKYIDDVSGGNLYLLQAGVRFSF